MTDETKVIELGNGWKRLITYKIAPVYRDGFLGVWDSIKAWVTGESRKTVPAEMTFSVYFKPDYATFGPQVEIKIGGDK